MRRALTILLLALCLPASAAVVSDGLWDAFGVPLTNGTVRFTPKTPWLVYSNHTVVGVQVKATTDANGLFTASVAGPAFYDSEVLNQGLPPLRILVPPGTNTYTLAQCAQLAINAQLFSGDNIVITSTGGGGGGGALTNLAVTNLFTIQPLPDTNTIYLSGFGSVSINGTPYDASALNRAFVWNNAAHAYQGGAAGIFYANGTQNANDGPGWTITNSVHANLSTDYIAMSVGGLPIDSASWEDFDLVGLAGASKSSTNITLVTVTDTNLFADNALSLTNIQAAAIKGALPASAYGANTVPGSALTANAVTTANIADYSVTPNKSDNTNVYRSFQGSAGPRDQSIGRYGYQRTLAQSAKGLGAAGQTTIWTLGSGLCDIMAAYFRNIATSHFTYAGGTPLYVDQETSKSGGAAATFDFTVWYDDFFSIPSGGAVTYLTNSPTANVFEVDYLKVSGGGSFTISMSTNASAFGTVASISTANASTAGGIYRWTNATVQATQLKITGTAGTSKILDVLNRNTLATNGVQLLAYTHQSSNPANLVAGDTNVWVPIFQSWMGQEPALMLVSFNDGGEFYITNSLIKTFFTNVALYLPNAEIVNIGCYPATDMSDALGAPAVNEAGSNPTLRNWSIQHNAGYFDSWNAFSLGSTNANVTALRGLMGVSDTIHMNAQGFGLWAEMIWNWLGIQDYSALANGTVTDARLSANVTLYTGYATNTQGTVPNFNVPYSDLRTNAAFTFLAPINVSNNTYQTTVVLVTNSTAVAVLMTPPAGVHVEGTWYVTNVTTVTFFNSARRWTNAIAFPLW